MESVDKVFTVLTIGLVGGIIFTLATHPGAISGFFQGVDNLYKTAAGATVGQVA